MWIAIALGLVVILFLGFVASRPAAFRMQRSIDINAPADTVFGYINDFRRWSVWSPWEKIDPDMQRNFSGSDAGVGAVYSWSGNSKAGAGTMTITESIPPERVVIDLEFTRPFKAENITEFNIRPAGGGVNVTWSMAGQNKFMAKAFALFVDMDKLIGKDFDAGLANLKAAAEKG